MTTQQILLMTGLYLVALIAVIYFTRATPRRIVGALIGGAVFGLFGMGAIVLGKSVGWWRMPFASTPYFLPMLYLIVVVGHAVMRMVAGPAREDTLERTAKTS
jgi:hypothetical protein